MWKDEIVEETRQAREAYAARFNYDLVAICRDLKAKELEEKRPIVSFPPKAPTLIAITKKSPVEAD
jgi:hypothetical protein